jgi:hypothetical protein
MKIKKTSAAFFVGFMGGISVTILSARFFYDIQAICQAMVG